MNRCLLFFILLFHFSASFAAIYYSRAGQTDPNALASWDVNMGGGGGAPLTFTNPDRFIIQAGHSMTTTGTWIFGVAGSALEIQNGATLQGDHLIQFTGTFQIDNGGTYIHNNNGTVAQTPGGTSIFSGTESFGPSSNFEIRNWLDNLNGLPNTAPGIAWGNLIVNMQVDLGGAWNWDITAGTTLTINGNLDIRSTYLGAAARELRFTGIGNQTINVGGDFLLSGTSVVNMKNNATNTVTGNVTMQVDGNVSLSNTSQLNLGSPVSGATPGVFDLRFKGNFTATAVNGITSASAIPYLVANGITPQTVTCPAYLNCNFKVAPGAIVNQSGSMANGGGRVFAILGTYNDNGFTKTFSGSLEVAGGIFNSTGSLAMGANRCRSCTGDGNFTGSGAAWCTSIGSRGRINFTSNAVTFDQNSSSLLLAGSGSSPGDIYLANNAEVGFTVGSSGTGSVTLSSNSILSIAGNSHINGNANYTADGGTLRIGSADGITATGNTTNGNMRVSGIKSYNSTGGNSFEYFGTVAQVTGDGLPTTISGTLTINNTSGLGTDGVTLSLATFINGILVLSNGKLTTSNLKEISLGSTGTLTTAYTDISFVNGPMYRTGNTDFIFPVGKGVTIHPIGMITTAGNGGDYSRAEYFKSGPACTPGTPNGGIHHVSSLEYWSLGRSSMANPISQVTLYATTYSQATNRSRLVVARCVTGTGWINMGNDDLASVGASGPVTSSVTMNNAFPVSFFTLASLDASPINPLPIDLISFDAIKLSSAKSSVVWELAACCSSTAKFEIQRAGKSRNFITIGTMTGSETNRFYNYTDNDLQSGINYYRLKMTDADGTITYSKTVAVLNGVNGLLLTSLIPTVITHPASLTVASSAAQKMDIIIVDMQGRIRLKQNHSVAAGNSTIQLSMKGMEAGVYQLTGISTEGKTNMIRFIKQ